MQFLWGMINILQLITIMALVSINLPGPAAEVNSILMQIAQVNLLPASDIRNLIFKEDSEDD